MTLTEIRDEARHTDCVCGAAPEQDCTCGPAGVHYTRVARACRQQLISLADFGEAIHDDVFAGTDVFDPERAP